jgi:hypothetical protein
MTVNGIPIPAVHFRRLGEGVWVNPHLDHVLTFDCDVKCSDDQIAWEVVKAGTPVEKRYVRAAIFPQTGTVSKEVS